MYKIIEIYNELEYRLMDLKNKGEKELMAYFSQNGLDTEHIGAKHYVTKMAEEQKLLQTLIELTEKTVKALEQKKEKEGI
jgi:hypothetical protein